MNKWALGPSSWKYVNYLLPFRVRFQASAELHDLWYSYGGTEDDKKLADLQFFENCLNASGKNPFAIFFSCIYYIAVANFGHFYFNYQQK